MTGGRIAQVAVVALACGLIWLGWRGIDLARGTFLFEMRYVALAAGALLVLSVAEWVARRLPGGGDGP